MEINIYENDLLSVSVKYFPVGDVVAIYNDLGWQKIDDKNAFVRGYIRMYRPHRIKNKDRLQYLQVCMETAFNEISSLYFSRHRKSTFVLALSVFISVAISLVGVFLSLKNMYFLCLTSFLSLPLFLIAPLKIMRARENERCNRAIEERLKAIEDLASQARVSVREWQEE